MLTVMVLLAVPLGQCAEAPGVQESIEQGDLFLDDDKVGYAIQAYREAIKRDPDNAEAHERLARALSLTGDLEGALRSGCRVELPGIYFAFNSAVLDPASDRTIAALAEILGKYADWIATIEGHTDSIGTSAANQTLSEQRAAAVRERLVGTHKVDPGRLSSVGYGSGKPRESNETIEGRAPNRRVELVRRC